MAALAGLACAPQQIVTISVEPAPADVFVDGAPLEAAAGGRVSLRADRGHVVLVRRAGYRPEQVVIESVARAGGPRLEPDHVAVRLVPTVRTGRRIDVELDADPAATAEGAPAAPADRAGPGTTDGANPSADPSGNAR